MTEDKIYIDEYFQEVVFQFESMLMGCSGFCSVESLTILQNFKASLLAYGRECRADGSKLEADNK